MKTYVLIVEDIEDTRNLLKFSLEKAGFEVISVQDGAEASQVLSHFIPDITVVDILMPEISGLDLIKQLRSHPRFTDMPIVVLSAYADGYAEEAKAAGATAILKKPIDTLELPQILNSLLPKANSAA